MVLIFGSELGLQNPFKIGGWHQPLLVRFQKNDTKDVAFGLWPGAAIMYRLRLKIAGRFRF
jgi:hypothetical protein